MPSASKQSFSCPQVSSCYAVTKSSENFRSVEILKCHSWCRLLNLLVTFCRLAMGGLFIAKGVRRTELSVTSNCQAETKPRPLPMCYYAFVLSIFINRCIYFSFSNTLFLDFLNGQNEFKICFLKFFFPINFCLFQCVRPCNYRFFFQSV